MNEFEWHPTMSLRFIAEWEDDQTKRILQQKWTRTFLLEGGPDGLFTSEFEWRNVPVESAP